MVDVADAARAMDQACWCTLLPAVVTVPDGPGSACWCRTCLQQHIDKQQAQLALAGSRPELASAASHDATDLLQVNDASG
ncbi:MAG: hypothetical protein ACI83P_000988 [Janthinobacterium sp.]|jgi:hypothetical protein